MDSYELQMKMNKHMWKSIQGIRTILTFWIIKRFSQFLAFQSSAWVYLSYFCRGLSGNGY